MERRRAAFWESAGTESSRDAIFKPHKRPTALVHRDEKHYPCSGIQVHGVEMVWLFPDSVTHKGPSDETVRRRSRITTTALNLLWSQAGTTIDGKTRTD